MYTVEKCSSAQIMEVQNGVLKFLHFHFFCFAEDSARKCSFVILIRSVYRKDVLSEESLLRQREIAKEERKLKAVKKKVILFER